MEIPNAIIKKFRERANSYPTPPDVKAIRAIKRPKICFEETTREPVVVKDFKVHPSQ